MITEVHFHNFGTHDVKLPENISLNKLNIFCGTNGSGKTLVLKSSWFMLFSLNMYKMLGLMQTPNIDEAFKEQLDIMFDMTFSNKEKISGAIMVQDSDDSIVKYVININEGEIEYFNINVIDPAKFGVGEINQIRYNTREARTFKQYERYRKFKTRLGVTINDMKSIQELGEFFRLYDIMWFEELEFAIKRYEKYPEEVQPKILKWSETFNAESNKFDMPLMKDVFFEDGSMYFATEKDPKISIADLSDGIQSLIMLTFFGV